MAMTYKTMALAFLAAATGFALVNGVSAQDVNGVSAQEQTLLRGKVVSTTGSPIAGIPVKAQRANSTIAVAVYTNRRGEYSFPAWSDLKPGAHTVTVELADYEHMKKDGVQVTAGKSSQLDLTLKARTPTYKDATAAEIVAALPGTDHQKVLLAQCSNCHSLQWALRVGKTKEEWEKTVIRMGGTRATSRDAPGTYAFNQKRFVGDLAEYLVSIRPPNSPEAIPFKLRPRPTDDASTNLVVTEYNLPRGGHYDLYNVRGDGRFVWPHDVVLTPRYAWYTDHFSFILGRMDRVTGEVKEIPFSTPSGSGREDNSGGQDRAGNPGGGAHDMAVDQHGNVFIGMGKGTVKYDPKAEKFTGWPAGTVMFGLDPEGNPWHSEDGGPMVKIDATSEKMKVTQYQIPSNGGLYDMDTDHKGRTILNGWRTSKIMLFDPKTIEYTEYPLPTKMSGPRRGDIDAQNRLWVAEYFAGNLAMFDAEKKVVKEWPLFQGSKSYSPPYAQPYTTSVDNKHQYVWVNDFPSSRMFRFDIKTEKMTEYYMPRNYEIRDLTVDPAAPRPTFWIPNYRPPGQLVKVQMR